MVGRDVARLPDLANHGSVDQTVLTDGQNEMIVERPYGLQTGSVRGVSPCPVERVSKYSRQVG
jgi:hypothetical protein